MITGKANASRNCVIKSIQVSTGMRNRVMPGARMFKQVTIRLTDETSEAMPAISRPRA